MKSVEWAAGVLEGEGSFRLKRGRTPEVSCQMTDLDVLEALQEVLGGSIYTPEGRNPDWKQSYVWQTTNASDGKRVMELMLPHMMARRKDRINSCLHTYRERKNVVSDRNEKILALHNTGLSVTDIAKQVGLSRQQTSKIVNHWSEG